MRLLIVSDMSHYTSNGRVVGWGPTVQEIDHLGSLFDEVRHVACLHEGPAPASALPYSCGRVAVVGLRPSGGPTLHHKLDVARQGWSYLRTIRRELPRADVVHVRCPASTGLLTVVLLALSDQPARRWVKYAGDWAPRGSDPLSYRFQRWWLRNGLHRGVVTVNGAWPHQPDYVHSFVNPCLTDQELRQGSEFAARKTLASPLRVLFAGALRTPKGAGRALDIVARIHRNGLPVQLDLVGDGAERPRFEEQAAALGIRDAVRFHGWIPRTDLGAIYAQAHILLLPSSSEGWPKVLSEGMAYGVVPVASGVGSIREYLERFRLGRTLAPGDLDGFAAALESYWRDPALWKKESGRSLEAAPLFSYRSYLRNVSNLLGLSS